MIHKKFMDIQRIKPEYADGFSVGDYIVIQEKVDGANAAIRYDSETDTIVANQEIIFLALAIISEDFMSGRRSSIRNS